MAFLNVMEYKALKKVRVRSVKIGIISIIAFGLVGIYIFGYQVLCKSRHFKSARPTGTSRIQAQRPVKDHCNVLHPKCEADFTPREDLSYCSQHGDKSDSSSGHTKLHPCEYWDEHQMNPTKQQGTLFMPTRVTVQHHQPTGKCGLESKDACTNIYSFDHHGNTTFIADVERFTLLVDHAFTMPRETIQSSGVFDRILPEAAVKRGSSVDFAGHWERCQDPQNLEGCKLLRIPCLPGLECDGSKDPVSFYKGMVPGTIGLKVGDVIPVGQLLSLAGINLDEGRNNEGESWREAGVAIQIDVDYENRQPFKLNFWNPGELHYIYRVSRLPVESFKTSSVSNLPNGDRILFDTHGIMITVAVQGEVAYFDATQLQLLLATCGTLLGIANLAVNAYAESMWTHSDRYKMSKYDSTLDLNYDDKCCCTQLQDAEGGAAEKNYAEGHKKMHFVEDLVSLDGEALRWAAHVLHGLHENTGNDVQDKISKHASRRMSADADAQAMADAAALTRQRNRDGQGTYKELQNFPKE